jgi:hypothetical protein
MPKGTREFLCRQNPSRLALGSTQPPPVVTMTFPGVKRPGVALTTHSYLAPRLGKGGVMPPLALCVFMTWTRRNYPFLFYNQMFENGRIFNDVNSCITLSEPGSKIEEGIGTYSRN